MGRLCWVGMFLLGMTTLGVGQQIGPQFLDRSFQRPGARALGMGGAYLLATDDATAAIWNPAALVNVKRFTMPLEIAGRAKNFRVQDITDLIDDLKDIRDQIGITDPAQVAQLAGQAIRRVRDFASRHGAVPGGNPATLVGSLAPIGGLTFGTYALTLSNGTFGRTQVFVDQTGDPDPGDTIPPSGQPNNIYARGGVVAMSSLALAHARRLPSGLNVGVAIRGVRADFLAFAASAGVDNLTNPTRGDAQGIAFAHVHKTKFTFDVGALWEQPIQPPQVMVKYAVVVRNLLPTRFDLPARDIAGRPIAGFDFSFRLKPEVDLGVMVTWRDKMKLVLERHNLTSSNGGDATLHIGLERWFGFFALRLGYDDDHPVFGFGINLRALRIDVAAGFKPRERLAAGISFRF